MVWLFSSIVENIEHGTRDKAYTTSTTFVEKLNVVKMIKNFVTFFFILVNLKKKSHNNTTITLYKN